MLPHPAGGCGGLQCYDCYSDQDGDCADPFEPSTTPGRYCLETCSFEDARCYVSPVQVIAHTSRVVKLRHGVTEVAPPETMSSAKTELYHGGGCKL